MIKIQMNQKYVIKSPLTGNLDFDENVAAYRDNLLTWGCPVKKVGDLIQMGLINGVELDLMDFLFIMSKDDGNVEGFTPWIKVPKDKLDNEIPKGLPNRIYLDREIEKIHSWRSWRVSEEAYPIYMIEEDAYFLSIGATMNALDGKELFVIYMCEDAELVLSIPIEESYQ